MQYLIILIISNLAIANEPHPSEVTDYKLQMNSISYPMSVLFSGSYGYAKKTWDNSSEDKNWNYGYYRIAGNAYTNTVTNRIGPVIEYYPISLFGISAGYEWGYKLIKPRTIDTNKYNALGALHRNYFKINGILGYKGFFSVTGLRMDLLYPDGSSNPFVDEFSLSSGRSNGDTLYSISELIGYGFGSDLKTGVNLFASQMKKSGGNSFFMIGFVNKKFADQWSLTLGAGLLQTDVFSKGGLGFLGLSYSSLQSLQIN